jgi:hypothetical protein
MAVTTANVYRCSVILKSQINPPGTTPISAGYGDGSVEVVVVAQNPASVLTILQTQYSTDLVSYTGPVLFATGALLSGTAALAEVPAPEAEAPSAKHATKSTKDAEEPPEKSSGVAKHANAAAPHR